MYDSARGRATFRGRKREFLVRKPDAGEPHVRFDERGVETGHGEASEAPATERVGKQTGFFYTTAPHSDSTNLALCSVTVSAGRGGAPSPLH